MCKAAHEPGGPLRCSTQARRRWLSSVEAVRDLDRCRSAILTALGQASPDGDDSGRGREGCTPREGRQVVNWPALQALPLSYSEQGATAGELPDGYHHIRREQPIGTGRDVFTRAAGQVMEWQMQHGAGVTVKSSTDVAEPGSVVVVGLGPLKGACRVIYVVDEPNRCGFAYGTLDGHPESGEEYFGVRFDPTDNTVYAQIVAFSRPGRWWSKAGSRVVLLVQQHITTRYLRALAITP